MPVQGTAVSAATDPGVPPASYQPGGDPRLYLQARQQLIMQT
jgi:hypothetical protein